MLDERFMNKYRIASARAQWHGYDGGEYFVTICTKDRVHYFGEIYNGKTRDGANDMKTEPKMHLSEIGKFADATIQRISEHNPYAAIPAYVIMPNHVHLIVVIDAEKVETVHAGIVETVHAPSLQHHRWKNDIVDDKMQLVSHRKNKLSVVVGGLKSAVTKYANENGIPFEWQSRFHDRIIRNTEEMNEIAKYIEENVAKWQYDEFYEKSL